MHLLSPYFLEFFRVSGVAVFVRALYLPLWVSVSSVFCADAILTRRATKNCGDFFPKEIVFLVESRHLLTPYFLEFFRVSGVAVFVRALYLPLWVSVSSVFTSHAILTRPASTTYPKP